MLRFMISKISQSSPNIYIWLTIVWLWGSARVSRQITYLAWQKERALLNCRILCWASLLDPLTLITFFTLQVLKLHHMVKFHILLDTLNIMMPHFCGLMLLTLGQMYFLTQIARVCWQTLSVSLASLSFLFSALILQRNSFTHLLRSQGTLPCPQLKHLASISANGLSYQQTLWYKETKTLKNLASQLMSTGWISFILSNTTTSILTLLNSQLKDWRRWIGKLPKCSDDL